MHVFNVPADARNAVIKAYVVNAKMVIVLFYLGYVLI